MYPITVRELHGGWIVGEERILMTQPGIYGWNDSSTVISALDVHCFDAQANGVDVRLVPHVEPSSGHVSFEVKVPKFGACAVVRGRSIGAASSAKTDDLDRRCVVNGTARASCFGTNASDSTDILQAALSSGASTVLIDDIGKPWIVRPLFVTTNDSSIIFGRNVRLLAKRDEFHGYNDALLSFRGVRNITVVGNNATLQMRRADYAVPSWGSCPSCRPYKKSEWRAGIMIAQSDDLRISGLNIVESGGDGFYIHCAPGCRNLHISDCVADSNYRQGMVGEQSSVTSLRCRLT